MTQHTSTWLQMAMLSLAGLLCVLQFISNKNAIASWTVLILLIAIIAHTLRNNP